ncbi:MAG TPA: hypothetical protein VD788_11085 [Candidatus Polarisedimenticolaceae bacterium]|nr:hypothetical protein [Candidatus Polarisedimenticolaceae bacterium]
MTTTTKTTVKGSPTVDAPESPTREEIQAAYQIHTLSRILYNHMANAQSWSAMMPTNPGYWGYPYGW